MKTIKLKYINIDGLDVEKYRKLGFDKGWDELEKELVNRLKEGVKLTDDVWDEIDGFLTDVFRDLIEAEDWKEVNEKTKELQEEENAV